MCWHRRESEASRWQRRPRRHRLPCSNSTTDPLRFEFSDGKSNKFWEIRLEGSAHTVNFGRIGTNGQSKTKEFADEDKARASAEKLIAEKTKKGYHHTAAAGQPVVAAIPQKVTAVKQKAVHVASRSDSDVVLEITSEINLRPQDWHRATFRKRKPLPLPCEEPFDYDACKRRMTGLKRVFYFSPFDSLELSPAMSTEEAHYWWHVLSEPYYSDLSRLGNVPPEEITGTLSLNEAEKTLCTQRELPPEMSAPLYRLLGHDAFVSLLFSELKSSQHCIDASTTLAAGFVIDVLPYLSMQHFSDLRDAVKSRWPKSEDAGIS